MQIKPFSIYNKKSDVPMIHDMIIGYTVYFSLQKVGIATTLQKYWDILQKQLKVGSINSMI